jgi:hypothetical protein
MGLKVQLFQTIKLNAKVMKKTTLQSLSVVAVGLSLCLWSCKEQDVNVFQSKPVPASIALTKDGKDALMTDFAKSLAMALKSEPDLRVFVKDEALKQIDGDYDIFYQIVKDKEIRNGLTLKNILEKYSDAPENFKLLNEEFLELNIKIPRLQVASAEGWNTQTLSPNVAVRSMKESQQFFDAFDKDGKYLKLDSKKEPNELTIVIEESERIEVSSKATLQMDAQKAIEKIKGISSPRVESFDWGCNRGNCADPDWYNYDCPRSLSQSVNKRQILSEIYIPASTWRYATDTWAEGEIELMCRVLTLKGDSREFEETLKGPMIFSTNISGGDRGPRRQVASVPQYDTWLPLNNVFIRDWDNLLTGDTWKVYFYELDPGDKTISTTESFSSEFTSGIKLTNVITKALTGEINFGYKGVQTGTKVITYKDTDDILGSDRVKYCEKLGSFQQYNTGSMQFRMGVEQ